MKVLSFGSLNIDRVYGVEHFVAPGETINSRSFLSNCGGKGLNQTIALARAGADVAHAGRVGADGGMLLDMLDKNGVLRELVFTDDGPSGHAVIQVDVSGQNSIIVEGGANRRITEADADAVLSHYEAGDILVLQNEISSMEYILRAAKARGLRIALTPAPIDDSLMKLPLECVEWFLLNEIEGENLSGVSGTPHEICAALKNKYPSCKVVLTLGSKGVCYYDGGDYIEHGIYDVKAVDTTAAGDTFAGYFLACTAKGMPAEQCLERASRAAAISVSRAGAAASVPFADEVENTVLRLK